jgi:toxin ParE1/3/4
MTRSVVILDGAKADFREIKKNVRKQFGESVWAEVTQEFKNTVNRIGYNPLLGTHIDELGSFGYDHYRKTLVRQTRVVYEFDHQNVIVHLFIHTKRDFRTHIEKRLLSAS